MSDTTSPGAVGEVLDRHRNDIERRFNAVGSAVGKRNLADTTYVIVIYLRSSLQMPAEPVFIEDIPVEFVVTGEIRLHPGKRS